MKSPLLTSSTLVRTAHRATAAANYHRLRHPVAARQEMELEYVWIDGNTKNTESMDQ